MHNESAAAVGPTQQIEIAICNITFQIPEFRMGMIRYTAWYDPAFEICRADATHSHVDLKLLGYINELVADIDQHGLRNPVLATCKNEKWIIHPGKCRVAAVRRLGWDTIPAIVVNYDLPGYQTDRIPQHPGVRALGSQSQVNQFLDSDCRAKMCHRWLTIKKTHRANLEKPYR